jgi:DNA-binding MarR family transcriptional regulator
MRAAQCEVLLAHFQGERIALRDLVDRAQGLLSGPTLSRVVTEMEQDDLLLSEPAPADSRVKLLRPTARTLDVLTGRTEVAFAEFAQVVEDARLRIAAAQSD